MMSNLSVSNHEPVAYTLIYIAWNVWRGLYLDFLVSIILDITRSSESPFQSSESLVSVTLANANYDIQYTYHTQCVCGLWV